MASFQPTSPETAADQELYTRGWLTTVSCLDCLAEVGVQKNSEHMTSIQWSRTAVEACPELARSPRALHEGCPRLRASIDAAVRDGLLPIGAAGGC